MRTITTVFISIVLSTTLQAGNIMSIGQYQGLPGTDFIVQIEVDNSDSFVAFQADVTIPVGFKYIDNSAALNTTRSSGHGLSASLIAGNILRLVGYSVGNVAFLGNSGVIVSFTLTAGTVPATSTLELNQPMLGNSQSTNIITGSSNGSVTVLAPNITLSTSALDYGRVPLGSFVEQTIQITNAGNTDLNISGLNFNDPQFTTTAPANFTINPNSSQDVTVKFSPVLKGILMKQLQISCDDPDQATMNVVLSAVGYAINEIHTGNITGASSATKTLEFTLNNMETFTGFQFDLNLPQAITYKTGSAQLFRTQDQSISVNQINTQTLRVVVFSPGNKNFTGTIGKVLSLDFLLYGNAGYYPIGISNVVIANADGENILSASFGGSLNIASSDIYAEANLDFGDVSILSSSTIIKRIYNYGQEPLAISQLIFSSDYFKSNQVLPCTIQPTEYLDLPVTFNKQTKGLSNGTLKIVSNDPDENPYIIQLTGNAFIPNYLFVGNQNFYQGESKLVDVNVTNIEPFYALQFDLNYPIGLIPDINAIALSSRKQDHILSATILSGSIIRVIVYSPGLKSFNGASGSILSIPFTAQTSIDPTNYNLTFSNALMSNANSENILYSSQNSVLNVQIPKYGDTDGNRSITAYDAALVLRHSVGIDPLPTADPLPWQQWRIIACDVDGNGKITAYDSALILRKSVGIISEFPVENK